MLSEDVKKEYRILYIEWLKLKNSQPAPGTIHLQWQPILHWVLTNCTLGLDVIEEDIGNVRKQLKVVEEELSNSMTIVPERFRGNLKHSTVQILGEDNAPVGMEFFVSPQIVVTAYHNIQDSPNIRALVTSAEGQRSTHTLTFAPSIEASAEKCSISLFLRLKLFTLTTCRFFHWM